MLDFRNTLLYEVFWSGTLDDPMWAPFAFPGCCIFPFVGAIMGEVIGDLKMKKKIRETIDQAMLTTDELTLANYIQQAREKGMANHQITHKLTNLGWTMDSIAAAFQTAYQLRKHPTAEGRNKYKVK